MTENCRTQKIKVCVDALSLLSITKMGRGLNPDVYCLDRSSISVVWWAYDIHLWVLGRPSLRILVWIAYDFILGIKKLRVVAEGLTRGLAKTTGQGCAVRVCCRRWLLFWIKTMRLPAVLIVWVYVRGE